MVEPRGQAELWRLLRQATVRLADPAHPAHWGTGFFIARDVLLTCWHVGRDVADQRLLVQRPADDQEADGPPAMVTLGQATLLEAGEPWDLALLTFAPSHGAAALAGAPVVLPLQEQDPRPGASLLTSAFPVDAAGRHDATYAEAGRTTPEHQSREFLRIKGDGVVPGFSGSALMEQGTRRVCGVVARNELPGGASDGGLAVPLAVFRAAFPAWGEKLLRRNAAKRHPGFDAPLPDWTWPTPWDFRPYREEKRRDFVGRAWLFAEVRAWATDPDPKAPQALLIGADHGVGKSAFLAELVDSARESPGPGRHGPGIPIAAQHFCTTEQDATLTPGVFVRNLAAQLVETLPAYRQALEADDASERRRWLDEAGQDPRRAFDQAVLAPLLAIEPPPSPHLLLVVDALDEAQDPRSSGGPEAQLTIVQLLARHASRLPPWLKLLATSRRRPDVLTPLRQAFSLRELDAEDARNLNDLRAYAQARCQASPLAERLRRAHLSASEVAEFLSGKEQSSGKFLSVMRVLKDLASGQLPLASRADLQALPPGMDGFYGDAFERRFPGEQCDGPVREILGVMCEQRIADRLRPLHDLLRLRTVAPAEEETAGREGAMKREGAKAKVVLHSFDHLSLPQWLSEEDDFGYPRAGRFAVDRESAAERIRDWVLAEVTACRAHHWPYLVRHLASHLREEERPRVIAGLLREFAWLEARLRLAGIHAVLGDFALAAPSPGLGRLERVLRQGAHVLSHSKGWLGHDQLASQLLARLADDSGNPEPEGLRAQAAARRHQADGVRPRAGSLVAQEALLRTLPGGQRSPCPAGPP